MCAFVFVAEASAPHLQAAPFFDKLVFSKIKARLGGRVALILSGGAPLAPHVEEFLKARASLSCKLPTPASLTWVYSLICVVVLVT